MSNKVLSIEHLYFWLPEDFDGGLSDALRQFADYHDNMKNVTQKPEDKPYQPADDVETVRYKIWNKFLQATKNPEIQAFLVQTFLN